MHPQVWIFAIQAFSALDIATQTLVATYLGQNIRPKAFEVCDSPEHETRLIMQLT